MVLCVLNQPQMELGGSGGGVGATQTSRKRKRKLSAPSRFHVTEEKAMDVVTVEAGRHANESQAVSSPLPGKADKNRATREDTS